MCSPTRSAETFAEPNKEEKWLTIPRIRTRSRKAPARPNRKTAARSGSYSRSARQGNSPTGIGRSENRKKWKLGESKEDRGPTGSGLNVQHTAVCRARRRIFVSFTRTYKSAPPRRKRIPFYTRTQSRAGKDREGILPVLSPGEGVAAPHSGGRKQREKAVGGGHQPGSFALPVHLQIVARLSGARANQLVRGHHQSGRGLPLVRGDWRGNHVGGGGFGRRCAPRTLRQCRVARPAPPQRQGITPVFRRDFPHGRKAAHPHPPGEPGQGS